MSGEHCAVSSIQCAPALDVCKCDCDCDFDCIYRMVTTQNTWISKQNEHAVHLFHFHSLIPLSIPISHIPYRIQSALSYLRNGFASNFKMYASVIRSNLRKCEGGNGYVWILMTHSKFYPIFEYGCNPFGFHNLQWHVCLMNMNMNMNIVYGNRTRLYHKTEKQ